MTDTNVTQLVINKLTKQQYENIQNPSETELYLVPDEIDNTPTSGSTNPVTSDGIKTALDEKQNAPLVAGTPGQILSLNSQGNPVWTTVSPSGTMDTEMSDSSTNPVQNKVIKEYVDSLGIFDISAYHATGGVLAKYANLAAALGTNGANIPEALRKGGMSIKFIQSSDNKYVQYFLTNDEWSINKVYWQKLNLEKEVRQLESRVGDWPTSENSFPDNLINGSLDANLDYTSDPLRLIGSVNLEGKEGQIITFHAGEGVLGTFRFVSSPYVDVPTDINLSAEDIVYATGRWDTELNYEIDGSVKSLVVIFKLASNTNISVSDLGDTSINTEVVGGSMSDVLNRLIDKVDELDDELAQSVSSIESKIGDWVLFDNLIPTNTVNGSLDPNLNYTLVQDRLIGTINLEGRAGQTLIFHPIEGIYASFRFVSTPYVEDPTTIDLSSGDIVDKTSKWENELTYTIKPTEKSLVVIFKLESGSAITVDDLGDTSIDVGHGTMSDVIEELINEVAEITHPLPHTSFVWGSDLIKRSVTVERIGALQYLQAFCKYNGKIYSTDGSNIAEQDASSFAVLRDVALNLGHGNSLQLGTSGKAWASGWDNQMMYKVDLSTLTIEETVTLPTTGYTTAAVDDVNGLMYILQRETRPNTQEPYNFIVYDYINEQVISSRIIESFAALQAVDIYQGKIMILFGTGTATLPSGMRIYNTIGDVLSSFDLSVFSNTEPEGICFDRDDKILLVSDTYKNLYTITE